MIVRRYIIDWEIVSNARNVINQMEKGRSIYRTADVIIEIRQLDAEFSALPSSTPTHVIEMMTNKRAVLYGELMDLRDELESIKRYSTHLPSLRRRFTGTNM